MHPGIMKTCDLYNHDVDRGTAFSQTDSIDAGVGSGGGVTSWKGDWLFSEA